MVKKNSGGYLLNANPDVLKDPVFDFIAGTKIYLPQGSNLQSIMGI